ncbi:MAG TPA: hypothetical protein VH481_03015 [Nitrososphaeraceae archaeon]
MVNTKKFHTLVTIGYLLKIALPDEHENLVTVTNNNLEYGKRKD